MQENDRDFLLDETTSTATAANHSNDEFDIVKPIAVPVTNPQPMPSDPLHHSVIRRHLATVHREISALDTRIENILLHKHRLPKDSATTFPLKPTFGAAAACNSDTEHIYETISDDDGVSGGSGAVAVAEEPIYCSPYKSDADLVELWLRMNQLRGVGHPSTTTLRPSHANKSSTSDDPDNSSSAYQTGGSCNSNTLTLELGGGGGDITSQQWSSVPTSRQSERSTLVLYPPKPPPVPISAPPQQQQRNQKGRSNEPPEVAVPGAATMYTNFANLQQTMRLQQRLFRQALSSRQQQQQQIPGKCGIESMNRHYRAPNLSQYQFVSSSQPMPVDHPPQPPLPPTPLNDQQQQQRMEWKVKRRQDGSRYIVRRPVRTRRIELLGSHVAAATTNATTTDDDTISAVKIAGRYWTRDDRRRHVEKARERRNDEAFNKSGASAPTTLPPPAMNSNNNNNLISHKRKPKKNSKDETMLTGGPGDGDSAATPTTIPTTISNIDTSSMPIDAAVLQPPSTSTTTSTSIATAQQLPTVVALLSVTTV